MYTIPQNLAPNVNLSYCLDLMTLGSKLKKNSCWTLIFSNDLKVHFKVIQSIITKIVTFLDFHVVTLPNCTKMAPFMQVLYII